MKRLFLSLVLTLFLSVAYSQSNVAYMYSSEVFNESIQYNAAKEKIDAFAKSSREKIDKDLEQVESLFEIYNKSNTSLRSAELQQLKNTIISIEKSANDIQEKVFGKDGELQTLQKELMAPVEKMVVSIVETIAEQKGYDMVFDLSIVKNTIYQSAKANITKEVIEQVKKTESNTTN